MHHDKLLLMHKLYRTHPCVFPTSGIPRCQLQAVLPRTGVYILIQLHLFGCEFVEKFTTDTVITILGDPTRPPCHPSSPATIGR